MGLPSQSSNMLPKIILKISKVCVPYYLHLFLYVRTLTNEGDYLTQMSIFHKALFF